jgi:hypothetical protein
MEKARHDKTMTLESCEGTQTNPVKGRSLPPLGYKRRSRPHKEALLVRRIFLSHKSTLATWRTISSHKHSPTCNPPVTSSSIKFTKINKVDTHPHWTLLRFSGCWCFLFNSTSAQNYQCSTSPRVSTRYRIYLITREAVTLPCLRIHE